MAGNQQFCLRWNNHQSTLISVFDNLLESGTLVDCTLAAEGQYLKAHKVVLSACSPFFEGLFSQHYEKHPIIILKDVTFSELKAMLDYMYRGEVNISQEQLGTFLKAAESLQIKGLTDNSSAGLGNVGNNGIQEFHRRPPAAAVYDLPRKIPPLSKSPCFPPHGLVVEQRPLKLTNNNNVDSPPGSNLLHGPSGQLGSSTVPVQQRPLDATTTSPKRLKRRYSDDNTADASDLVAPQCTVTESSHPLALSTADNNTYVKVESKPDLNHDDSGGEEGQYDDEDEEEMDLSKPGTSQHNSHPPGVWNASLDSNSEDQFPPGGSQEQEASWMLVTRPLVQTLKGGATSSSRESGASSAAGGAVSNRSNANQSGGTSSSASAASSARNITCPTCNKCYSSQHTLRRHIRLECGKEPQFHCPYCPRKTKQRYNLMLHIARAHKPEHHLQSTPQPPTSHW